MWIFSNREVATFIYLALFIIVVLFDTKVRSSVLVLIKSALSTKIVQAAIFFLFYASFFTVIFALTPIWKWIYLKDIIMWVVFAGIPFCFKSVTTNIGSGYFRRTLLDQLKLMILIEFIISSFTFSLVVELILVFISTFIALLDMVAGMKDDNATVKKLTTSILAIIGILTFIFTIKNIVTSYDKIIMVDMLVSFLIPIVFLVLFLPVAYLFVIYARYESLYIRMSFKEPSTKRILLWHHWEVFKLCKLSYKKIDLFNQNYLDKMYVSMSVDSFRSLMHDFKNNENVCSD